MTVKPDPLDMYGVTARAIEQLGGNKQVLKKMPHRKAWHLSDWVNDGRENPCMLTYADAAAMTAMGATAFAEDLAYQLGMQLVPISQESVPLVDLMGRFSALMRESGEACATGATAIADGVVDGREASEMRRQLLDVAAEVHGLLKGIESLKVGS